MPSTDNYVYTPTSDELRSLRNLSRFDAKEKIRTEWCSERNFSLIGKNFVVDVKETDKGFIEE